ncbi:hypothetical protein [Variovorax sp. RA8]|uniref:hypothetical protein n=1 Tax=Variovorax sp. (strain JCM 16519 / RA8) TaxID=662548 RepID=UPI001316758A|nr:hypothetical protein [Variovorax sp. RA8]VTU44986.1 hypothetical protein RA8P2_00422 [Variovorax sp. RA8]
MRLLAGVPTRSRPAAKPPILSGMDQIPSNDQNSLAGWRVDALAAVAHLNGGDVPPVVAAALRALAAALAAPDDLAAPAWPVLTERAQVHGTVFEAGTSTKALVEEAIRYYEFEQQPPRVASRASVLDRFGAQVGALTSSKPEGED